MPCENCLNRRAFIATAAGVAGALVSGCGDGTVSGVPKSDPGGGASGGGGGGGGTGAGTNVIITVGNFAGLANTGQLVQVTDMSPLIAVKRTGATSFDAFLMRCTHEGCPVDIVGGQRFDCGCHGSRFNSDGNVINGPASQPLDKLTTSYDSSTDQLTITD